MAEAALGLAFSAISLAGLFQTCLDCYDLIDRGRNCGRDLGRLLTRLEIEKLRLSMWGESVDICRASERMSGMFEHRRVRNAVCDVLKRVYEVSGILTTFFDNAPIIRRSLQTLRSFDRAMV